MEKPMKSERKGFENLNEMTDQEKLELFKVEELEPRLEMGGWGGDDSCNGSCDNSNDTCNSCCGDGNPCCNTDCQDFGCGADVDAICITPV